MISIASIYAALMGQNMRASTIWIVISQMIDLEQSRTGDLAACQKMRDDLQKVCKADGFEPRKT